MKNVSKQLRDKYMGSSEELQIALMDIKSNKEYYDSILQKIMSIIELSCQETINIFIGCEQGKHRSVAVVCMLSNDIYEVFKSSKELIMNVRHRDLENIQTLSTKKEQNKARTKDRDRKIEILNHSYDY
jgi:RNase adaptor protein for sRNA GlmZ degradation